MYVCYSFLAVDLWHVSLSFISTASLLNDWIGFWASNNVRDVISCQEQVDICCDE